MSSSGLVHYCCATRRRGPRVGRSGVGRAVADQAGQVEGQLESVVASIRAWQCTVPHAEALTFFETKKKLVVREH